MPLSLLNLLVPIALLSPQRASEPSPEVSAGMQDAGRIPQTLRAMKRLALRGRVRDSKGEPWCGARVVLVSNPVPGAAPRMPDIAPSDVVETVSDDRGAFRAELIPGRTYTAWAVSQVDEGRFRATAVANDVAPGVPLSLDEDAGTHVQQRVRIEGGAAWKGNGPLRYLLRAAGHDELVLEGDIDDGKTIELPPTAGTYVQVEVRTHEGLPLASTILQFKRRSAEEQAQVTSLRIHPPATTPVHVSDASGNPLPDARITWKHRTHRIGIGRTGSDGVARITLPRNVLDRHLVLWIEKAGFADCVYSGAQGSPEKPIEVALRSGVSVKGRLLLAGGKPAAGMPLVVHGTTMSSGGGYYMDVFPQVHRTDASGRFEFGGVHPDCPPLITAVLQGSNLEGIDWDPRFPNAPTVLLYAAGDPLGEGLDLGDLDLTRLSAIDLTLRNHTRRPIPDAMVTIVDARQSMVQRTVMPLIQRVNRLGRLRLIANLRGLDARIVALAGGALIHEAIPGASDEAGAKKGDEALQASGKDPRPAGKPGDRTPPIVLELTAPEPLYVQGTLSDSKGEPIAGATIRVQPNRGIGQAQANWNRDPWLLHLFSTMIWPRTRTDSKGHYRTVAPLHPATLLVSASIQGSTRRYNERQIIGIDTRNVLLDLRMPQTRADMGLDE